MEQAQELAAFLMESIKETKAFVLEQAPDICQQLILRQYILTLCLMAALILVALSGFYWLNLKKGKEDPFDSPLFCVFVALYIPVMILLPFVTAVNIYYSLLAHYAPKLFLLEELARFVK